MPTVFHYTDDAGLAGVTASEGQWYPSTGKTIHKRYPSTGKSINVRLAPHLFQSLTLAKASKDFYAAAFGARDWRSSISSEYYNSNYGPGWYVTPLPPHSSTQSLLNNLWRGNADYISRTKYWLQIEVHEHCLKHPDPGRPNVSFIAYLPEISRASGNPVGQNPYGVFLKSCGRRIENGSQIVCETINTWTPPLCVVEPFLTAVDAFETLSPDSQANLLGYLAMDSGLPGIADPPSVEPVELDCHQANALAHLIIKWVSPDFKYEAPRRRTHSEDSSFAVQLRATRLFGEQSQAVQVLFLSQQSPVRRETVEHFYDDIGGDAGILLTTSTFAANAIALVNGVCPTLLLVTRSPRFYFHTVILTDAVISFPGCELWLAGGVGAGSCYVKMESKKTLRSALGLAL